MIMEDGELRKEDRSILNHEIKRKKNILAGILKNFETTKSKLPKKKLFNWFIIMTVELSFMYAYDNEVPNKYAIKVHSDNANEMKFWLSFKKFCIENNAFIDRVNKKEAEKSRILHNRYRKGISDEQCGNFFSDKLHKIAFELIIKLIFSQFNPTVLSEKFKLKCCRNIDNHTIWCYNKWESLLDYLMDDYVKEIDANEDNINIYGMGDFLNEEW